jgi:antitoxin CptB
MSDLIEARKRRLRYRAWHRGTKEADLLIGGFVDARLESFTAVDMAWMEQLLEEQDVDIMAWMTSSQPVPAAYEGALMQAMRQLDFVPEPGSGR